MRLIIFFPKIFLRESDQPDFLFPCSAGKNEKRNVFYDNCDVSNDCMGLYRISYRALLELTLQHSDKNNTFPQYLTAQLKTKLSVFN